MNRGGAETLLMNLFRQIDRTKVQFDFLTCKPGVFDSEIEELGGIVHRIPYVTEVGHFKFIKALQDFFNVNHTYQIIHSHLDKMSGLILKEAYKVGIPMRIAHSHNTKSEGNLLIKTYKSIYGSLVSKYASHLFACSADASKWLFNKKQNQAIILKNGININKFSYSKEKRESKRQELNILDNQFVVGHVGRFNHQKNHIFLIEIFAEIHKRNSEAILILVGDGILRNKLEEKVRGLGLKDQVKFIGVREDVDQILMSFDVLLFPSIHEGLPLTLVESQGSGLPCVISDCISDEIDMGAGLIQKIPLASSPQIWADCILKSKKISSNVSKKLRDRGYDIQETASWLQNYYLKTV